jgi:hypothetical protein
MKKLFKRLVVMLKSRIDRAALGRAAKIGALYDVRTEQFLVISLDLQLTLYNSG